MFDPTSQGLAAVSARSALAPPLVFAAGAVSSVGPCVAPRFIAVAGLAAGKSRIQTAVLVSAFIAGLTVVYAAFGAIAPLLGQVTRFSGCTYAMIAVALSAAGCLTLWRGHNGCAHEPGRHGGGGSGGAFLLGGSCALVLSPCCAPLVLGILTYASGSSTVGYASGLLACFALGHALPVLAVGFGVNGITQLLQRHAVLQASCVVSASLMLGLGGYYAVLA